MFDTMTLTKIGGSLCGALLIFLLGGWFAETVYGRGSNVGDQQAFVVETGGEDGAPVEEGPSFEEIYATADAAAGAGQFRPCAACHSVAEGDNRTGPTLYGVVGRAPGTEPGFTYSGGFSELGEVWTPELLDAFIANPRHVAPDTTMNYAGMRNASNRADLVAYLDSLDE